jgi:ABC-type multidrug transport system permease subunit
MAYLILLTATILSTSLSNQLQVEFLNFRNIYEYREQQSKMYSWVPLVTSSIVSRSAAIYWGLLNNLSACRVAVQHLWFCHVLLLLVLDRWVFELSFSCWVYGAY